jgi:hypothetical protein
MTLPAAKAAAQKQPGGREGRPVGASDATFGLRSPEAGSGFCATAYRLRRMRSPRPPRAKRVSVAGSGTYV